MNSNFFNVYPEIGTDNYLIYNQNFTDNPTYQITSSQLLKISPSGVLLDSLNFNSNFFISSSLISVGNFYYCYGTQINSFGVNLQGYSSILSKIDQNLNIVKQAVIDTTYNNIISDHKIIARNNNLYIGNSHSSTGMIHLYKTNLNLSKEDSTTFVGSDLSDLSNYGNKIITSGSGFTLGSVYGNNQVMEIDSAFNVLSRFNLDSLTYVNPGCGEQIGINGPLAELHEISPNKYVVVGFFPVVNSGNCITKFQNITSVIKNNSEILKTNIIGDPVKDNITIISHINENKKYKFIYTVAETGINLQNPFPPQTNTTQILVHKIDTMGNLMWAKYFSEPDMYYCPYNILTTADSGVAICGMRYNIAHPAVEDVCEGFVMKIDKDGNQVFVGIKENSGKFSSLKCFPNPSSDQIQFDIPFQDKIEISVYSTIGEEVLSIKDYQNLAPVKIDDLSKGVYFYKIKTSKKNYSGKFIKE